MVGEKKQSEEYAISFSEGLCITTSGLGITTKLQDKVDVGRRYQENLVFDIPARHKILVLEFFFRDYFPQMYNFHQAPLEVPPCASENY